MKPLFRFDSLLLFACLFSTPMLVFADPWQAEASVDLRSSYSDNETLSNTNPDAGFNSDIDVGVVLSRITRNFVLRASADAEFIRYNGIEALKNEDNQRFRLQSSYQPRRNVTYGLFVRHNRDTTSNRLPRLDSIFDGDDVPSNVDSGLTARQFGVDSTGIAPSINLILTPKWDLRAAYSYSDTNYGEAANLFGLFDFDQQQVSVGSSYQVDAKNSASLRLLAGQFDSQQGLNDLSADTYSAIAGYRLRVSETFDLIAEVGVTRVDNKDTVVNGVVASNSTVATYRVQAIRKSEAGRLIVSYERSVEPSAIGELLRSDLLKGTYSQKLTPRQSLRLRLSYLRNRALGPQGRQRLNRDFLVLEPGYRFLATRKLQIGIDYRYRWRDIRTLDGTADGHAVIASLTYKFGVWDFD